MKTIDLITPKCWEMLTDNQLRYVFGLIAQGLTAVEVKTYCLIRWSGMQVLHRYGSGWWCKYADDEFEVTASQVTSILSSIDWLDRFPSLPVRIKKMGGHWALPNTFQEVPFETFIICDNLYQGYLSAKADQLLDDLALVLYQSAKVKPDPAERVGVFYWFASLKEMFAHQFNHFFQPLMTQNNGNMFDQGKSQYEIIYHAVNSQIRALTKGDVTKEKDVLAIDTWRALTELDALAKEYDDFNKKYPNK